jgi:transcriptional regulator with XRE-family HTH domain
MPRAPEPDKALSAVLKREREQRELTQEHVAYNAGLSVATLQKIEHGQTAPSWDSVRRIIAAMGVSLVELAQAVVEAEG